MGLAIKCYFTDATESLIRVIWDELARSGHATFMKQSNSRPGITLGVWESAAEDQTGLQSLVEKFVSLSNKPPAISSFGIATFPTDPAQVFLGVLATEELLGFHRSFHELDSSLSKKCSAYYRPGTWVPHSTLAIRCPRVSVPRIIEVCMRYETRIECRIGSIGLLETETARQIFAVEF